MRIYLMNNFAKFYPDPISNDGSVGFLKRFPFPNKKNNNNNKMSSEAIMRSVPDLKITSFTFDATISGEIKIVKNNNDKGTSSGAIKQLR